MEQIKYTNESGKLVISLSGRIDSSNSAECDKAVQDIIAENKEQEPVFDMSGLEYISSAGLRVLMRVRKAAGKELEIINAPDAVYSILETTGFTELFRVSRKMREISVDGCEIIGKGFYGTVYRIDPETIVKVYNSPESLSMIQNEKQLAKTALVAGVPTAISYDIVRVGNSYGSVFELLNAKTFNDLLISEPENAEEIIKQYSCFLRMVNSQTVPPGRLKSAKGLALGYLETAAQYLETELYDRLKKMLIEIPEQHNVIHGDAQMKNVMMCDGEPMLIDMDTLAEGHPIFDLQSVYVTYYAFPEDEPGNTERFLGIPEELSFHIWDSFVKYYFDTEDDALVSQLRDKITIVGCIRFIALIDLISDHDTALFRRRIEHSIEHLKDLAYKTETLLF